MLSAAAIALSLGAVATLASQTRARQESSAEPRNALEQVIFDVMFRLLESSPADVDGQVLASLESVLNVCGADALSWYVTPRESPNLTRVYSVSRPGTPNSPTTISSSAMPWLMGCILQNQPLLLSELGDLPSGVRERDLLEQLGTKSLIVVPSSPSSSSKAVLVLGSRSGDGHWTPDLLPPLRAVASLIAATVERSKAQRASSASELQFRALVEEAPIGIALEDVEGRLLLVNPALCQMLGYRREELIDLTCHQITEPHDAEAEAVLYNDMISGRRASYQMEKRFIRKDGTRIWGRLSVALLKQGDSAEPRVIGMVTDITQTKAVEEKLRFSETRLQSALDTLPNQVAILDEHGNVLAVNSRWRELAIHQGMGVDLRVGGNYLDVCGQNGGDATEVAAKAAEGLRRVLGGETALVGPLTHSCILNGELRTYQMRMARFEEHGATRVVLSYEDITEVTRAREELAKHEETLSLALEASHTGTWELDAKTGGVSWTGNAALFWGNDRNNFAGTYTEFLHLVHPDDRKKLQEETMAALRQGEDFSVEFRIIDSRASVRWILCKGKVISDVVKRPLRILGVNVDVTELKKAEVELRRVMGRLIQAQEEERRRISRELHDDISQRLVLLSLEITSAAASLDPEQNSALNALNNLQRGIEEIASDIHGLSHQLHSTKLQNLGLRAALRELCQQFADQHGLIVDLNTEHLTEDVPPDIGLCLFRVAQEAMNNVVKHSHAQTVSVTASRTGGKARLKVQDSGIGFDPESYPAGVGLASMRERLRFVGGNLLIASTPNHGTEIVAEVSVPASLRSAAAGSTD